MMDFRSDTVTRPTEGMRRAGVIAAALYAFGHHIERLAEDHERATTLAIGLRDAGYDVEIPETNIVLIRTEEPSWLLEEFAREGVLATPGGAGAVRLCTHLDITGEDVEGAVQVAAKIPVRTV